MTEATAEGPRVRAWPWLVLALATVPAIWYVADFESDIDPEFPRVVRPTFNTYPPPAYRFAEAGDTIDHVAVYVASAALVLSGWGCLRGSGQTPLVRGPGDLARRLLACGDSGPADGRLAWTGLAGLDDRGCRPRRSG